MPALLGGGGTNRYNYAYDPIGNRLSEIKELMSTVSTNVYESNELNQYTNISNGTMVEPEYDADGNMLTYKDWTFSWNGENRLATASNSSTRVLASYTYDYMGRNVEKSYYREPIFNQDMTEVIEHGISDAIDCIYDGWNLIQEKEHNVYGGLSTVHEDEQRYHVWGLDLSGSMQGAGGIGGLLFTKKIHTDAQQNQTTNAYYFAYDANGNVTDLVDTNGTTVGHYEYDAFGNTTVKTGTMADGNPFRFSTKYLDGYTGLYYYGRRYYSPELGRWVSRDPIGEWGGKNLYAFVVNNAVSNLDILGLQCISDEDVGGVSGVGVTVTYNWSINFEPTKLSDPITYGKEYLISQLKDEVSDGVSSLTRLTRALNQAKKSAKKMAGTVGLLSQFGSSAGLWLDEIEINSKFKCCTYCEEDEVYKLVSKEASAKTQNNLFLSLRNKHHRNEIVDLTIDIFVKGAKEIRKKCPKREVSR